MTRTAFTHEILEDGTSAHRVVLTMDAAEAAALGEVAGAAVDCGVVAPDFVSQSVLTNAEAILSWASRASLALALREGITDGKE